jgi:hypothetical protein
MNRTMKLRRSVLAAAVGVTGPTVALASPAGAIIIGDPTDVTASPQTDVVAGKTPVTVAWTNGVSGPMRIDLCDVSAINNCVSVYSSTFESYEGSVTRTLPGSVNGKKCYDGTANFDITCTLKVTGPMGNGITQQFQIWFKPASTK